MSDTSPLRYLVQLGHEQVLPQLFGEIVIPSFVRTEMQQPSTPQKVRAWAESLPDWITVRAPVTVDLTLKVHRGEQEAISLALELGARLILLDDRAARLVAAQRGLRVTGLLAIVETAGERNLLSLPDTLNELRQNTSYRIDHRLVEQALARHQRRIRGPQP